ncbi:MAG: hypothetical protein JW772_03820 [Candidatus Diapherotrites archaeon]|nr:hypothetical protein [Candidatus Diapherotrites archaeon]
MRKGQLFSLDLLFSLGIIILGLGMVIQFSETRAYSQKEEMLQNELNVIGDTAASLLISNPDIICELEDGSGNIIAYLDNCINEDKIDDLEGTGVLGEALGIPLGYDFGIYRTNGNQLIYGNPPDIDPMHTPKNVFAEIRTIATLKNPQLTFEKSDFEDCLRNAANCRIEQEREWTVAVWRT